jgi:hypothetical protein
MFTGSNNLMQFALKKQQQEAQDKLIQAQSQALKDEARLVQNKYGNGYPDLFATIGHNLDDAMLGFCNKLDKDLRAKNGFTQELNSKVRNSGLDQQQQKFVADIQSQKQVLDIGRQQVLACKTMSQADGIFNKLEGEHHKVFGEWQAKTTEMSNKWLKHFDTLVAQNNQGGGGNNGGGQGQNELEALKQKFIDMERELKLSKDAHNKTQQTLNNRNAKLADKQDIIDEQKITIDGQAQELIQKQNTITDQQIEIQCLNTKVEDQTIKYTGLKQHFDDLVHTHQELDQDYAPPVIGNNDIQEVV